MITSKSRAGVIGVGAMGQHHARVYSELADAELVGVADADRERAEQIAAEYGTNAYEINELIRGVDLVTIAVPTAYHYDIARDCINAGVDVLIEKPIVEDPKRGNQLIYQAERADVTLQVGHIERFNPVTMTLADILPEMNVIAIDAERLGPRPDRTIEDTAVIDLMIHDIDLACSLIDGEIENVDAIGAEDGRHATATLTFDSGVVGTLTASRVTQQKVRKLRVTCEEALVLVDYIDQSIEIHRQSAPEYVTEGGKMRYRHESIVEHPAVDSGEPLKFELASFVDASREGTPPQVDGSDGIRALKLAREINRKAFGSEAKRVGVLAE